MKSIAAIALLSVLVVARASAAEIAAQTRGFGAETCAQFAEAYRATPDLAESLYFTWGEGFMTGMNLLATAQTHSFRDLGAGQAAVASQKQTLREYCNQHPLSQYMSAVLDLYLTLPIQPYNSN